MTSEPRGAIDWTVGPAKRGAAIIVALGGAIAAVAAWRSSEAPLWHVEAGAVAPDASPAAFAPAFDGRIDINAASAAELDLLPGIGPALAARIVEDREKRGPFARLEDLDRVKGIGARTIERMRPHALANPAPQTTR